MSNNEQFAFSCSHTTRGPRPGEEDGVHYHFVTNEKFEADIAASKFLEYAHVHGNYYGTSIDTVASVAQQGKSCVLDIDVQGARQVRKAGLKAIFVFIAPPSMEELEARLRGRGTESEEQISKRLGNAQGEMDSMEEPGLYDYILVNSDLTQAAEQLKAIGVRAMLGQVRGPRSSAAAKLVSADQKACMDSRFAALTAGVRMLKWAAAACVLAAVVPRYVVSRQA